MGNTTHLYGDAGAGNSLAAAVYGKQGGSTLPAKFVYTMNGGVLKCIYSTPAVSVAGTGSVTDSGASAVGTTSASVAATPGGNNTGNLSYSYGYVSGDAGFSITSGNGTATPTFSHSFSGVPNGSTSAGVSATWSCTITDNVTGATYETTFTVGPFAWQNTIPAYVDVTISGPSEVSGSGTIGFPGTCNASASATGVASNGNGSYSYSWTRISASAGMTPSGASTATLTLSISDNMGFPTTDNFSEIWRCTTTDGVSSAFFDCQFDLSCTCLND